MSYLFTSESVSAGHPDKLCDQISDGVLDAILAQDPHARVACEASVKNDFVLLFGEVTANAEVDFQAVVREVIRDAGYSNPDYGFSADTAEISVMLDKQSPDIKGGVDNALETRGGQEDSEIGAGDQGMMFGYATAETDSFMPLPIALAHKLCTEYGVLRRKQGFGYLRPDAKSQVTVEYTSDHKVAGVRAVVVSAQHDPDVEQTQLQRDLKENLIKPVLGKWWNDDIRVLVNPSGRFVTGGPVGDAGLTGRKIIVDTYGGAGRHGGGAFSGKDPTKVDRSGAYAARYIAKNVVAAGLAERVEVQLAYAIGVAEPVSFMVNTFGTGKIAEDELVQRIRSALVLTPGGIIKKFGLQRPIYRATAVGGHFGRNGAEFGWEQTDLAPLLASK